MMQKPRSDTNTVSKCMHFLAAWRPRVWIGGYKEAGSWQWFGRVTGPINYIDEIWASNDDDGVNFQCLIIWGSSLGFADKSCDSSKVQSHYCETKTLF